MSETTTRLLQAASEAMGGSQALAARLGIDDGELSEFMDGRRRLPEPLLLTTLDIIFQPRHSAFPSDAQNL